MNRRELLCTAIEEQWQDVLLGIRIYIRKFGLSQDPDADDALARDTLQDAIILALQNAARYDPARPARPWLLGFALNGLRRSHRDRVYERQHVVPVADLPQVQSACANGRHSLSEEEMFALVLPSISPQPDHQTVDELLSPLSEPDRAILKLHFEQDLRGKDLAQALGINEGQAWARLSRARTRLREYYGAPGSAKKPVAASKTVVEQ